MTFERVYQADPRQRIPVRFFARGFEYKFLGLIPSHIHLLGVDEGLEAEHAMLGWTELARVIRGRFLALREEDFVISARLVGCSQMRIIFVHIVPSFMSRIIAAATLALPAISSGVLLQLAQNVQTVALSPWLMLPALPVIVAVLAFNFLGEGLRHAADPDGH